MSISRWTAIVNEKREYVKLPLKKLADIPEGVLFEKIKGLTQEISAVYNITYSFIFVKHFHIETTAKKCYNQIRKIFQKPVDSPLGEYSII